MKIKKILEDENLVSFDVCEQRGKTGIPKSGQYVLNIVWSGDRLMSDPTKVLITFGVAVYDGEGQYIPRDGLGIAYRRYKKDPLKFTMRISDIEKFDNPENSLAVYMLHHLSEMISKENYLFSKTSKHRDEIIDICRYTVLQYHQVEKQGVQSNDA